VQKKYNVRERCFSSYASFSEFWIYFNDILYVSSTLNSLQKYICRSCPSNISPFFAWDQRHLYKTFSHCLYSPLEYWPLIFSFMIILQTAGLLGRVISSTQGLYLNTGQHKHRIYICTYQTSMPCVGFEPTITTSERAKTFHDSDSSATVTGIERIGHIKWTGTRHTI
jgi:hypothetical protein